jgi:hypothetical protein
MIYKKAKTIAFEKHGIKMRVYNSKEDCPQASVVYQETETGHSEEFYHTKSTFIFYIIEGQGTWFIEDMPHAAVIKALFKRNYEFQFYISVKFFNLYSIADVNSRTLVFLIPEKLKK